VLVFLMSIIVVGVVATIGIPLELFPRGYTGQNLRVFVPWQDAPVQEVLQKITLPLEEELSTVRGSTVSIRFPPRARPGFPALQARHRHGCRLPGGS
jgi:Cu/Ag efflux pump CusA